MLQAISEDINLISKQNPYQKYMYSKKKPYNASKHF